jgi:hypothetical protein
MPIKGACIVAGIGVTTLAEWREQYPGLEVRFNEARERARQKELRKIKDAGERDWRASVEWLKLTFPNDYRPNTKIDVTATASASAASAVVVTEERRQAILERRAEQMRELERE